MLETRPGPWVEPASLIMSSLLVGTDCSGVGLPVLALRGLGVSVRHVFASEICPLTRRTLEANAPAEIMYADLRDRINLVACSVDLYVAGFPCQPFSQAGTRVGFEAAAGNGHLFFHVADYIRTKRPKAFILENVLGLFSVQQGDCFTEIWQTLCRMVDYNVHFQPLNTKDHGVPQNRPRIYFVGIRRDIDQGSFQFPSPLSASPCIEEFLDARPGRPSFLNLPAETASTARQNVFQLLHAIIDQGNDPFFEPWVLDCDSSIGRARAWPGVSPCLTRSRGQGHWISNRGRRMNCREMLRLQGWNDVFYQTSSDLQLGQMLGNSMSINVLQRLYCTLLPAAGLVSPGVLQDPWSG